MVGDTLERKLHQVREEHHVGCLAWVIGKTGQGLVGEGKTARKGPIEKLEERLVKVDRRRQRRL